MEENACPICFSPLGEKDHQLKLRPDGIYHILCPRCGHYSLTQEAEFQLNIKRAEVASPKVANISGWIREHQGYSIQSDDVQRLKNLPTPTPAEKAVKMLSYLESQHPVAGIDFKPILDSQIQPVLAAIRSDNFDPPDLPPNVEEMMPQILELCGICTISTREEYDFILRDILTKEMNWITWPITAHIRISPTGWEFLDSLKRLNPASEQAFVAMRIHPEMDGVYKDGISVGILDAGYKPILISQTGHTNRIDDEIFVEINRSRFVVADYTGQRQSVYYESGYAKALGLTVFWLCDYADKENLHFDVEHYSYIFYYRDKLPELRRKLTNWILSNFPQGAYSFDG